VKAEHKTTLESRARRAINRAKARAEVAEAPCEVCGTTDGVHAHHDDYAKPLDVRWLCADHHADVHRRDPRLLTWRVRRARVLMGMNQIEFAAALGVAHRTVSRWEMGAGVRAQPKHLVALATLTNRDPDWFVAEIGDQSEQEPVASTSPGRRDGLVTEGA
jgi:DNA-binding XRE family transcriptional regulator